MRVALLATAATAASSVTSVASASPDAVDVTVHDEPPARRVFALEYNPVALLIGRISGTVEIVPVSHHALVLSPYYFDSRTSSFPIGDGQVARSQRFEGYGGEIGYRYYAGERGPRGFFAGISFMAADVQATGANGQKTTLGDLGPAVDVGYQALLGDDWVVSLGGGAEYTFTTESLPDQQAPANIYANSGLHPRLLAAVGYAF